MSAQTMDAVLPLADRWLQLDRDPETRAEITDLIVRQDATELEKRLRQRIAFGTAGLRSSMKAGFAHMNSLNVLTTSIGLANYICETSLRAEKQSVVIGYDGRHRSRKFACLAATAFLESGLKVLWFDRLVHTPLVPFTVSRYGAAAGVMVTASHNPKNDNGYKVYWANGSQIIPPHDLGIARAIDAVQNISSWDESLVEAHSRVDNVYDEACEAYFEQIRAIAEPSLDRRCALIVKFEHSEKACANVPQPYSTFHIYANARRRSVVHARSVSFSEQKRNTCERSVFLT
jgi:phosphoglucomutase